jgi:ketosteroid isomerase-like protein
MMGQSDHRSERTMPTRERVQTLIDQVEGGRYVEAIESFYHEDASMQENLDPPRRGRATLIRGERRVIEAYRSIPTGPVRTFMVEGDRAVINWVFEFVDCEGRAYALDELAFQLWRGERIIEERFYCDPAQRARRTAPG